MKKTVKKSLCAVLCALLLLPSAGLAKASGDPPLTIYVAADTHYKPLAMLGPIGEQQGLPGDPLYWHTNIQGELDYESEAIINSLLSRFEASNSRVLLIAGDITKGGRRGEHSAVTGKLRAFEHRTGKNIFVINGNHDIDDVSGPGSIDLAEFKTMYADFGYSQALDRHDASASYTADLGGGYRLIAIDSCVYGDDLGKITPAVLSWVEEQAAKAKADGQYLVGLMHHSALEHFKNQGVPGGGNLVVENYREISAKFADWGIKTIFTGHVHASDISEAVTDKGGKIYDIETGSLITFPNAYRIVTFSEAGVEVRSEYIDAIDTADLAAGYNAAQLELLENDFPAFSRGYQNAAMNRYITEYIGTPRKVARLFDFEPGSDGYKALAALMAVLGDALNLPIYETASTEAVDSLEEIAALAGETIEPSEFKKISDIVSLIFASHYTGDENIPYDSLEIRVFLQAFKGALTYALVNIPTGTANNLIESFGLPSQGFTLNESFYTPAAKLIYMRNAATRIIGTVIKPLLQSFTVDSFTPGDINETLEPYGVSGAAGAAPDPLTDWQVIADIVKRLLRLLLEIVNLF